MLGKFPVEVFGKIYTDKSSKTFRERKFQYCPYLKKECTKPRKSEPKIKVGICTVGYKGSFNSDYVPVIICPVRFLEEEVFQSVHDKFFPDWKNTVWIKEVNMGVAGSVDYVVVKVDENGTQPSDFFCVEFQANGTTGSPYGYVRDLFKNGKYEKNYNFGLNWANEFLKTMMQQIYKKGSVVNFWGRKIIFVIQDVSLDYLRSAADVSGLRKNFDDPIHFMTYKLIWNDVANSYNLKFHEWVSADLNGINKILAGANAKEYLSAEEFFRNAVQKGRADGVFDV